MNQDTALMRGVRTAIQAFIGVVVGLFTTIWSVPGVSEATVHYLGENALPLALAFGIPAGIASFIWNYLRKDVPNY